MMPQMRVRAEDLRVGDVVYASKWATYQIVSAVAETAKRRSFIGIQLADNAKVTVGARQPITYGKDRVLNVWRNGSEADA